MSGEELPKGWELVDFDVLVASAQNGLSKRQGDEGRAIPVLRLADFDGRQIAPKEPREILLSDRECNELSLRQGDLLCVRVNGSENIVGRISVFRQEGEWSFCDHFIRYRLNSAALSDYIGSFFETSLVRRRIESSFVSSAGQKTVNRGIVGSIQVPLAPLAEQRRIVEKIEALTARSRRAREALDALPSLIDRYRQSILAAAFRGDLTAEWRAGESAEGLADTALEKKELEHLRGLPGEAHCDDEFEGLPRSWVIRSIRDIGDVTLGRQRAPQHHTGEHMRPYLRVANVFEDRIDTHDIMWMNFTPDEFERFKLEDGDVLLNEGQSKELIGRPAIYNGECAGACFTNTLVRFRPSKVVLSEYALLVFLHYMHSGRFQSIANITTNIAHLGAGRFAELPFPVPTIGEQAEIVRRCRTALSAVENTKKVVAGANSRLSTLDQSILAKAFRGELVPQDPNDEPASVLLERIRAERAAEGEKTSGRRGRPRKAG